jgi:single-strand selective monofunctional uracil DNA glycosylase
MPENPSGPLIQAARDLADEAEGLSFSSPVAYVYNPLKYAWKPHELYLSRFGRGRKSTVFVGMNPGPWGMAQTGVPFGEIEAVRVWMGIEGPVGTPPKQHPARPVKGYGCHRSEVSGRRLWGLMKERFGGPEAFFERHFVSNYCPLLFLAGSGRNITPDKLPNEDRSPLLEACDRHLRRVIEAFEPQWIIGVGKFTERRIRAVSESCEHQGFSVGGILHPSPANPRANRNWAGEVTDRLMELGVWT